jgi:hypothetical protein
MSKKQFQWLRTVLHSLEECTQTRKMKFAEHNLEI